MRGSARSLVLRCCLLCLGLLIMSFGVALSIRAGLGTSPISSLPYVVSRVTPPHRRHRHHFSPCGSDPAADPAPAPQV